MPNWTRVPWNVRIKDDPKRDRDEVLHARLKLTMAWETRNRRRYFYAARRVGAKVVKTYCGCGPAARTAAEAVARAKASRLAEQQAAQALVIEMEPLDQLMDEIDTTLEVLTRIVLKAKGYRNHKGSWRMPRDSTN